MFFSIDIGPEATKQRWFTRQMIRAAGGQVLVVDSEEAAKNMFTKTTAA